MLSHRPLQSFEVLHAAPDVVRGLAPTDHGLHLPLGGGFLKGLEGREGVLCYAITKLVAETHVEVGFIMALPGNLEIIRCLRSAWPSTPPPPRNLLRRRARGNGWPCPWAVSPPPAILVIMRTKEIAKNPFIPAECELVAFVFALAKVICRLSRKTGFAEIKVVHERDLLNAGSFSIVYRGRRHGINVAVKDWLSKRVGGENHRFQRRQRGRPREQR